MDRHIFTIGHSTHTIKSFISLLNRNGITRLVDIRTIPRSGHNPQFNSEELKSSLEATGITYEHMAGLGGLRRAQKDSVNQGWKNAAFRGFADYMQTAEFKKSMDILISRAGMGETVIMCAESVPWRCHRSLIADALLIRGIEIKHIMSMTSTRPHSLTPWAKVEGLEITYPMPKML